MNWRKTISILIMSSVVISGAANARDFSTREKVTICSSVSTWVLHIITAYRKGASLKAISDKMLASIENDAKHLPEEEREHVQKIARFVYLYAMDAVTKAVQNGSIEYASNYENIAELAEAKCAVDLRRLSR